MTALVRVELTQAQVAALVYSACSAQNAGTEHPRHGDTLTDAVQLLTGALEASLLAPVAQAADPNKPAMGETPKKKRGRPAGKAVSTGPNALPLNARCAKVGHVVSDATPGRCGYCGDKLPETAPALPGIGGAS